MWCTMNIIQTSPPDKIIASDSEISSQEAEESIPLLDRIPSEEQEVLSPLVHNILSEEEEEEEEETDLLPLFDDILSEEEEESSPLFDGIASEEPKDGELEALLEGNTKTNTTDNDSITHYINDTNVQLKIFSYLPIKSIFKFKCVSRKIQRSIEEPLFGFEHFKRESNVTGFFFQHCTKQVISGKRGLPSLLSAKTGDCTVDPCYGVPDSDLSFLKEDKDSNDEEVILMDSCNGLLLCRVHNIESGINKLYVCNPLTMQKVLVSYPPWKEARSWLTHNYYIANQDDFSEYFALIARSTPRSNCLQYEVLCVYDMSVLGDTHLGPKLWVYSSESRKWEDHTKDVMQPLPSLQFWTMIGSKVIIGDTLFWDCFYPYILVYDLNKKFSTSLPASSSSFYLLEAPNIKFKLYERSIWEYNGKLLCYCDGLLEKYLANTHDVDENNVDTDDEEEVQAFRKWSLCWESHRVDTDKAFPMWSLCWDSSSNTKPSRWEIENSQEFRNFGEDVREVYSRSIPLKMDCLLPSLQFKIIAYNPSLRTMYLSISKVSLVSYSIIERCLDRFFGFPLPNDKWYRWPCLVPYVHNLQEIVDGLHPHQESLDRGGLGFESCRL